MACGWSGDGREGNYLLGERPLHSVAQYSPSMGTEASHCSQWSRGIRPVTLTVSGFHSIVLVFQLGVRSRDNDQKDNIEQ